jgi:hypothetical protein
MALLNINQPPEEIYYFEVFSPALTWFTQE